MNTIQVRKITNRTFWQQIAQKQGLCATNRKKPHFAHVSVKTWLFAICGHNKLGQNTSDATFDMVPQIAQTQKTTVTE